MEYVRVQARVPAAAVAVVACLAPVPLALGGGCCLDPGGGRSQVGASLPLDQETPQLLPPCTCMRKQYKQHQGRRALEGIKHGCC